MNRSLSLNALARRGGGAAGPERLPGGQVLWMHATSDLRFAVLCDLASRLKYLRDDLQIIATYDPVHATISPEQITGASGEAGGPMEVVLPLQGPGSPRGRQLLQAWEPELGLWTGGQLGHPLIRQAHDAGTDLILLDANPDGLRSRKRLWFSDPVLDGVSRFERILVDRAEIADTLIRAGIPPDRIEQSGPLRLVPTPPDGADEDVMDVSQTLAGRPVWLAAQTHPDEFADIIAAHHSAVRHAHRLLLVIVPDDRAHLDRLMTLLGETTLRHSGWYMGDQIEDQVQVLVADDPEDLGLWYRVAPQCFLGHSLFSQANGRCPMHAAALGSAILHGPRIDAFSEDYDRLHKAGAARVVSDGPDLGTEVARLIAPDLAATMALAGWDVATEGAELNERILQVIQDKLDQLEEQHARA